MCALIGVEGFKVVNDFVSNRGSHGVGKRLMPGWYPPRRGRLAAKRSGYAKGVERARRPFEVSFA